MEDGTHSTLGPYERARPDDRLEIADLIHRYAYHFDRNEPELVADLFTEDAVIDYGPEFPPIIGRDTVAGRITPGLETIFAASSHHIGNVIVDFVGSDEAGAIAYVYAWHRYVADSSIGQMWGQYHLDVRRTADGWRIAALTLRVVATEAFHRDRMHPIGRRPVAPATPDPGDRH